MIDFGDPHIWVLVAFVIFIGLLGRRLTRMIAGALDKRSGRIRDELDEARRLREEAQALLASYQRRQRDAIKEAADIVAQAREDALRIRAEAKAELQETLARRREQAVERIARAETQAVQEVREAAADLAFRATRRLIGETIDPARDAKLVSETIETIDKKLH